jgi:hypothetical protein
MTIVAYAYRPKQAPRRKLKAAPLTVPAIVKVASKGERARRREAGPPREVSAEEEPKVMDLLRRMMRPREE